MSPKCHKQTTFGPFSAVQRTYRADRGTEGLALTLDLRLGLEPFPQIGRLQVSHGGAVVFTRYRRFKTDRLEAHESAWSLIFPMRVFSNFDELLRVRVIAIVGIDKTEDGG
jgi:hypothetical protein